MTTADPVARKRHNDAYYAKNREKVLAINKKKRQDISAFLRERKEAELCMDCGVSYPYYVMDFDHRPGEVKICDPSRLINCGSWDKVHAELAKCDLVCSNCHRIRTFERAQQLKPS